METMKNDDMKPKAEIDFGDDTEIVPSDAAFETWLTKVAPELNEPKAVPRPEMWDAIQAARRPARDGQAGVTPIRRNPWRLMSLIAAALLLGVAIDRVVLRESDRPSAPVAAIPPTPAGSSDPARLYRMAAAQTLTQAEALLTAYRASAMPVNPAGTQQLGRWGRDILSSTRLLIDSPAGEDPQLRSLLNDLELVLVQIIQLSGAQLDASDRALIDRALEDRDLLPRIRTAVPAGVADAAASDE
jgi:hypothetical protein